jgi:hypothetical protein
VSWDVTVQRFSRDFAAIEDIPETERCVPLGSRADVQAAVCRYFPGTDWSDPAWGIFDFSEGSIEFNLGKDEPSEGFMMHIRASAVVVPAIVVMCRTERWQALDCSNGAFLEKVEDPATGLEQWATYRDQIVAKG